MENDRIENVIRRLRFEHDEMTQQELADRVGCTRQTIIALEAQRYRPSLQLAFRIAHALDSSLETVFQYVPNTPHQPDASAFTVREQHGLGT